MSKSLKLSPNHGVNPSMLKCPVCGKEYAIALLGKLKGDAEAPKTMTGDLCDECRKKYITIIESSTEDKPTPTGECMYVPRQAISARLRKKDHLFMLASEFQDLKQRIAKAQEASANDMPEK